MPYSLEDYIVIIPARAGSQRIIDKNNKKIGENSLVEWAIKCALTLFSKKQIVLVTDSKKSVESGAQYGIRVLGRTVEVSTPNSSTESVIELVMEHYPSEKYVLLQPTSPFRTRSDLKLCIDCFEKSRSHSVMSVTLPWHPPKDLYTAFEEFENSFIPKNILSERNKKYYFDTGAIYVFYAHLIRDKKPILDLSYTEAVRVNQMAFFDIDYEFHLDLARAFFSISGWEVNK